MTLWRPAGHIKDKMLRQAINAQALVRNQILIGKIATIKKKLTSWKSDLIFRPPTHETQRFKCFVISTISTLSRHLNPHPLDINPSMKPSRSWKWWLMSHIISDYVKTIRCCDKDSPTPPTHCRAKNSHRNFFSIHMLHIGDRCSWISPRRLQERLLAVLESYVEAT